MDNTEKVLDILDNSDKPLRSGEIADKAKLAKKEVEKIIKVLKSKDLIYSPQNCFYDIKR